MSLDWILFLFAGSGSVLTRDVQFGTRSKYL